MLPHVPIFGLEWHIRQSPAQRLLVADPLQPYIGFEPIAWDGADFPKLTAAQRRTPVRVFFQLPPPREVAADPALRVVWIPMWDEARGYEPAWWRQLPKSLRVVAFSREVSRRAKAAGLATLDLQYFPPDEFPPADWTGERVLFYWNRIGLVGADFLSGFCRALAVDRLICFRTAQDRVPAELDFPLADRIGNTRVEARAADELVPRREYAKLAGRANIFLAPRTSEGVGLTFLEALARGCAVFAYDAPTMNEYIAHGENGYLLRRAGRSLASRAAGAIERRLGFPPPHPVSGRQDWHALRTLDLKRLGADARRSHRLGLQEWTHAVPQYARFLLDG
jgi:hypothetical protein